MGKVGETPYISRVSSRRFFEQTAATPPSETYQQFQSTSETHDLLLVDINRRLQYVIIVISEAVSIISRRPFTPVLFECKWGIEILYHYAHFETIQ